MAEAIGVSRHTTVSAFAVIVLGWAISTYLWLKPTSGSLLILGVSLAVWGIFYFAAIGFLLTLRSPVFTAIAFVIAAAGCGASLQLSSRIVTSLVSLCPLCLVVPAATAVLVILLWNLSRKTLPFSWVSAKALTALGLAAVVAGGALESAVLHQQRTETARMDPAALWEQYRTSPQQELPVEADEPVLGPNNGAVQMVVFSSFGCPACRTFSPVMHRLHDRFGDRLAIIFKHYPLSSDCNPALKRNLQPRSCEAAWAAEAANRQRTFWSFHDGLFRSDLASSERTLLQIAQETNLDRERWNTDRTSSDVQSTVKRSVDLGTRLRIDGTPSVFVNGRRVRRLGFQELETVITKVIEQSGGRAAQSSTLHTENSKASQPRSN